MNLSEIEDIIRKVEKSLEGEPRNEYEHQLRKENCLEHLKTVESNLQSYSGDYVEGLRKRVSVVEEKLSKPFELKTAAGDAFSMDFDGNEAEDDDELERAELEEKLKAKKKSKEKSKKKKDGSKAERSKKEEPIPVEPTPAAALEEEETTSKEKVVLPTKEIFLLTGTQSTSIPTDAVGEGTCAPVPETAKAVLNFEREIYFDNRACFCEVSLYRSVLLTLATSNHITNKAVTHFNPTETGSSDSSDQGEESLEGVEEAENDDDAHTAQLANALVVEYNANQIEKEEEENSSNFPTNISIKVQSQIRDFSHATWTILMCHGGYFAGGVFSNGKCVVHKAFQRYVVRKKQGGKQSTNAKDGGGSYGSVGSQIRAAQEIKWKIDVRNILCSWRELIDSSTFIFYVAPGPQNRSVLTDFSSIPGVDDTVSPIRTSDPRVRSVPLTTHRPKFEEVERIFNELATVDIRYLTF